MRIIPGFLMGLLCASYVFAQDMTVVGSIQQIVEPSHTSNNNYYAAHAKQLITLLKLDLSINAKAKMQQRLLNMHHQASFAVADNMPATVQLGMENVPVLNQGVHGSCVTFSVIAGLDAVLKKADYISELCSLQLGRYLQSNGYLASGWDGSLAATVLAQFDAFGLMSKQQQRDVLCGGLKEYPANSEDLGQEMSLTEFHQYSESLVQNRIGWTALVDLFQSFHEDIDGDFVLQQVKKSLQDGDRLTFGVLLADYEKGLAGAVGSFKTANDTWLMTPEIIQDTRQNPQFAGHEMLITGYDDTAIAKDDHGRSHRGLLTLRNSWGDKIGNKGDFYMSYDYFKELVIELYRIRQVNND